jgi:hypothetical protein
MERREERRREGVGRVGSRKARENTRYFVSPLVADYTAVAGNPNKTDRYDRTEGG